MAVSKVEQKMIRNADDPWRLAIHRLPVTISVSAGTPFVGEKIRPVGEQGFNVMAIWGVPTNGRPDAAICVKAVILDARGLPNPIQEFGAHHLGRDEISLSTGDLRIDPDWRRRGIAGLAIDRLVEWARLYHPKAKVNPYNIGHRTNAEQDYLLRLYGRVGFKWNPKTSADNAVWKSVAMTVADLAINTRPPDIGSDIAAQWLVTRFGEAVEASFKLSQSEAELSRAYQQLGKRRLSWWERISGTKNPE
jgi:GNAT superfamily N-acetyltransferase